MGVTEELWLIAQNLDAAYEELTAHIEHMEATSTAIGMDDLADLVVVLDALKKNGDDIRKRLNKANDVAKEVLCNVLFENEIMPYRNDDATLSPSARGFFSVQDPNQLLDWLRLRGDLENPLSEFLELATKKKPLQTLCEEALEAGQPLPPGIKGHVTRTITVRRKGTRKNG